MDTIVARIRSSLTTGPSVPPAAAKAAVVSPALVRSLLFFDAMDLSCPAIVSISHKSRPRFWFQPFPSFQSSLPSAKVASDSRFFREGAPRWVGGRGGLKDHENRTRLDGLVLLCRCLNAHVDASSRGS